MSWNFVHSNKLCFDYTLHGPIKCEIGILKFVNYNIIMATPLYPLFFQTKIPTVNNYIANNWLYFHVDVYKTYLEHNIHFSVFTLHYTNTFM